MRIEGSGITPLSRRADGAIPPCRQEDVQGSRDQALDEVQLSTRARMLAIARQALQDTPPVRRAVVEAARTRLHSGQYRTDGNSIAEALLAALREGR